MFNAPLAFYLVSIGSALLFAFVAYLFYTKSKTVVGDAEYDAQLEALIEDETVTEKEKSRKITIVSRWNTFWGKAFKDLGWSRYSDEVSTAGRDVLIVTLTIGLVAGLLIGNVILGIVAGAVVLYIFYGVLSRKAQMKSAKIDGQLPGFLFALKANVQANVTPESAIVKIVDTMPSPLHEDLLIVKRRVLANATFAEAIEELSQKTSSRDLKFLCACIIQASLSGANLEKQIDVIQEVLNGRRKVTGELQKAVSSAKPAIFVSSVVIPGVLLITMLVNPEARNFWFKEPISFVMLGVVGLLYAASIFFSKKLVDGIRKL